MKLTLSEDDMNSYFSYGQQAFINSNTRHKLLGFNVNQPWNKITNSLNPDIVAITGDLVDGSVSDLKSEVIHLKELKAKYGVFFVTGNHEFYSGVDSWCNFLESLNIRVLRNQAQVIENDQGDRLYIAGVDDYSANSFPGYSSDVALSIKDLDKNIPIILLAHQPNSIYEASRLGVKLQLSGHTHAGQIWPFNYLVKLQQPYVKGLNLHNGTALYISSGTGQWGPPMRFLTKTEVTSINLISKP
jgi:predicted MPP superfamily phosphohydrolase